MARIERFYAANTPEAAAFTQISNSYEWSIHDVDEALVALYASYTALNRYLIGHDLFIVPTRASELESVLRRYAYDSIHSNLSQCRSTLKTGGYSRVCHLAENSIRDVLRTGDNGSILLSLHRRPINGNNHERNECPTQTIKTN